jgi:anti-sigma28 factor (negative regulator of flagellin synthesis)
MSIDYLLSRRAAASTRRIKPASSVRREHVPAEMDGWVEKAKALPDIRWDKVAQLREALQAGQYDVDVRLNDMLADLPGEFALLNREAR